MTMRSPIVPLLVPLFALAGGAAAQDGIQWHQDLKAATELARREDRPLLLLFRCER